MALGFGIGAADASDAFMDAPNPSSGGKKAGDKSGENPVSSFLDLVGIHIGGKDIPPAASSSAQNSGTPVAPDPKSTPAMTNTNITDSQGDVISSTPNQIPVNKIDIPDINVPPPKQNFLQRVLSNTDSQAASSNAPGSPQVQGNSDGSFGGGLGKALMKLFAL